MSQFFIFLFFCFIFVFALAVHSNARLKRNEQIEAYFESREQEVLHILPPYRSGNEYEVTYSTAEDEIYKARCIFGVNSQLFWSEPEFVGRISHGPPERLGQGQHDPAEVTAESTIPNKEQLINGLTSGQVYERIQTALQIGEMEEVDELVLYILMDLSFDDPEPEVREAARESLERLETAKDVAA